MLSPDTLSDYVHSYRVEYVILGKVDNGLMRVFVFEKELLFRTLYIDLARDLLLDQVPI